MTSDNNIKEKIEYLINQQLSTYAIAKKLNLSQTGLRYWLRKLGLHVNSSWSIKIKNNKEEINSGFKTCSLCKKTLKLENFFIQKSGKIHSWCKDCNYKTLMEKQHGLKQKAIDYKGGKCSICGYDKYNGSLEFHHLDPSKKEFNISEFRTYDWETIKSELDKCICVCRNCHGEIHGKIVTP